MAVSLHQTLANLIAQRPPSEGRVHVLAAFASLFILRWADLQEADQEAVAAFDGTSFTPTLTPGSRWRDLLEIPRASLADALTGKVIPGLALARDTGAGALVRRLRGVAALSQLGNDVLAELIELVRALPIATPADREQVLDEFDRALAPRGLNALVDSVTGATRVREDGELLTPADVVSLVVDLASPQPGERIYDPCFGVAAMLAACARRVRAQLRTSPPRAWADAQRGAFSGVELRPDAFVVGLARMILAGVDRPALELGNTLERPLPKDRAAEGFDCIVCDPPFGGKLLVEAAAQFSVKATSSEALFLQHVMASLRPGGRAVVVLPHGAFFRGGADAAVRRILLEEYRVEAVVSLPAGAYLPWSGVKTGVLVIRREEPGTYVRFVDVERPIGAASDGEDGMPLFDAAALAATMRGEAATYDAREIPAEELKEDDASFDPPRRDGPLPLFLQAMRAADATVPIRALEDVADVFTGFRHRAEDLVDRRNDPTLLGFLRVTEIGDGDTKPPARFLTRKAMADVPPEMRLRSGDVVVTRSGSVGRVAVIANGALGCVAAQGLAVLRGKTDVVSPHYLAAMLQSGPLQAWMTEQARGLTIRHVPISGLRRLEIPVPDLSLQDRVLRVLRREGGDAASVLLSVLTGAAKDPIAKWLESSAEVRRLIAMAEDGPPEEAVLSAIEMVAFDMHMSKVAWAWKGEAPTIVGLSIWATNTANALVPLMNVHQVPPGAARLAVLDLACRRLERELEMLRISESKGPTLDLAWELTRAMVGFLDAITRRSVEAFKLVPSIEPASLDAGTAVAVTVRVRNEGPMPLRSVVLGTPKDALYAGSLDIRLEEKTPYLDAGQEIAATAAVLAPKVAGRVDFMVTCEGERLDGQRVSEAFPLALEVRPAPEAPPAPPLGASPYIVANPIDQRTMLYGRDKLLREIKLQLPTDHRANIVLLEGNRRTGKTSILKRLEAPGELPGWIPVYTSLQGGEGHEGRAGLTSREIFRHLARDLALALSRAGVRVWPPDTPLPDPKRRYELQIDRALTAYFQGDHPFEVFEIYVETATLAAAPRKILLMLDEFDKIQEGIDAGVTSPQVPENLRYLFHAHPDLGGILSGSRRLTRLRNEYWSALFGIGYAIRVGPLALDDARALVTGPVAGRLVYVPAARDRIVELCACHPFLIQTLCNRIFTQLQERDERTVLLDAVERAAAEMTADSEHFETLWGYAATDRRRLVLTLLCELVRGSEGRALDAVTLEDALQERGVRIPREGLGDDMAHLRELELVELTTHDGYQRYRMTVPLMAEWIRRNKDFSDLARRAAREQDDAGE